jgi:CrcB protein
VTPLLVLAVVLSGGLAAVARYGVSVWVGSRHPESPWRRFPWAVLIVNAAGSALAGVAAGLASASVLSPDARLVLIGGMAGGLTTFSTFSVETVELVRSGRWRTAVASGLLNLAVGLALATGGYVLAASFVLVG